MTEPAARGTRRSMNSLLEFVLIVAVALGLALLIQAFLVKPFRIPSGSMEPTLGINQRVLVDRVTDHFGDPGRGTIVVFKPPKGADDNSCGIASEPNDGHACQKATPGGHSSQNFIKRIVAVGGDTIAVKKGRVYLNGSKTPQKEPFIRPDPSCGICNLPKPIKIPPGYFFMMGDNRGESADSREWGPVPKRWLIGRAFFTYWPIDRIGTL
ncbi:MAG: signal peptidase I [Actinobacteria bacterium]|nr:signal peptidase I [Actinomycetota bacterium]